VKQQTQTVSNQPFANSFQPEKIIPENLFGLFAGHKSGLHFVARRNDTGSVALRPSHGH